MLNIVAAGDGAAVLLRAAEPLDGWVSNLTGPGRLAKGLDVTLEDNGLDLTTDDFCFWSAADYRPKIVRRPRIGVDYAKHWAGRLLRFILLMRKVLPPPSFFSAKRSANAGRHRMPHFRRLHRDLVQRLDNYHAVARRCMPAVSAGILLHVDSHELRVLLAHPGGPYFSRKDLGSWTIPKGLVNNNEDLESAARREFEEELGWSPSGAPVPIGQVKLGSGKIVHGFALQGCESEAASLAKFQPGTFSSEWPPQSGCLIDCPEIDRIAFFPLNEARAKLAAAQLPFLDRLRAIVS